MKESNTVINVNFPSVHENNEHCNYQLIKNDILEAQSEALITSYSVMANRIIDNAVTQSRYLCDISRDEAQAMKLFELIVMGSVPDEILDEMLEEIIG